jgi:hypothetical protein
MKVGLRCFIASAIWLVATLTLISIIPMAMAVESGTELAYIYSADSTTAKYYISLLENSGYQTDMILLEKGGDTDLSRYDVIIIGPDTTWSETYSVDIIKKSNKPLIGLGEGGYELFGQLILGSGYPNGWHGSENSIYVTDPSHPIFQKPNSIMVPRDGTLQLYKSSEHVGIYMPSMSTEMVLLGRETGNKDHYPLLLEENKYLFWGFTASPESMTDTGRILFTNILAYMSGIETRSEELGRIETTKLAELPVVVRPELMRIKIVQEPLIFATPVETVQKKIGDTVDLGDGYILLISEVNANREVVVQLEQNGERIEEKVLVKDQNYLLPKATGQNISIKIGSINLGDVPADTYFTMFVGPSLLLTVVSQPAGADIFIDDKKIDSTPKDNIILTDFDEHNLRLELEGYQKYEESIRFTQGGESKMVRSIKLTSSMMQEQTLDQTEEEQKETEEAKDTLTDEEEKLQAEKGPEEQESVPSTEAEPERVPGFLLITAFMCVICGYGLIRLKKG